MGVRPFTPDGGDRHEVEAAQSFFQVQPDGLQHLWWFGTGIGADRFESRGAVDPLGGGHEEAGIELHGGKAHLPMPQPRQAGRV